MKVVITGSNGYIGRKLINRLQTEGYECIPVKREFWDRGIEKLSELLAGTNVVVNLAGAPVLQRWTAKNKAEIYSSRVLTTQKLVSAIYLLPEVKRPKIFISASAVGIYQSGETHNESSTRFASGFLGKLVQDWEQASATLPDDVRRVVFRVGLALGNDSKTIKTMLPAFRMGLGGKIGSGKQVFPFVHVDDLVSAFLWVIKNPEASGIYNLVAPQIVTNQQFTLQLAQKLKRPAFFAIPSFILKIIFGEASQLLIESPSVIPERLIKSGFIFSKSTISEALDDISK
ncbi:MAG: TIGR01777 family protein [Bacteroidetes bacterium GWF2_42_66]|nr:MAG: TIGR01777 family protein [Bacteroidetes bacterium GWA2_42_15]OFY01354.1 MAG: TIGR01777 family protein [Bacteroidetes bacterium GWE2_42_39]OFY42198.1 MAG: TIGR01777 family protein [Bacteroidetes bacterium GWF2_42_66]HBL77587.1 TIGR01777 family protein [Prolixibacteraceae bacterium]HCB62717.1 TIGR01777 family protein [Bacteroidales bacterium]